MSQRILYVCDECVSDVSTTSEQCVPFCERWSVRRVYARRGVSGVYVCAVACL